MQGWLKSCGVRRLQPRPNGSLASARQIGTLAGMSVANQMTQPTRLSRITDRFVGGAVNVGVAALGVLLVHELAYALAGWLHVDHHSTAPDHHHQSFLMAVIGPIALLCAAAVVIRQARRLGLRISVSPSQMSAMVSGLYLLQESIEVAQAGGGIGALVANRAVPAGLALAPIIAWALSAVLTQAATLVREWLGIEPTVASPEAAQLRPVDATWRGTMLGASARPRAPPFSVL